MSYESDPKSIDEHRVHEPGSFMDVYRSIDTEHVETDEEFVDKAVHAGVIPSSVRYGVMRRGGMETYRGVVKSREGFHYFNWSKGNDFKLVPADTETKLWEADKLYRACSYGCDMRKADEFPIDPGESVEEDDEDDTEKTTPSAVAAIQEDQYIKEQHRLNTEHHPGSTYSHLPDDPTVGRQWHEKALSRPGDGTDNLATNDGEQHWDTAGLMKAWGQKLQGTAPSVAPKVSPYESQYLQEVLGVSTLQIEKGMKIPPRHRVSFEQWKTGQLRGRLGGLKGWLQRNNDE